MTDWLILAIDQGTSSTRAIAFDRTLRAVASAECPLATTHARPGWAEQDPTAILGSVIAAVAGVLDQVGGRSRIAAVGLDNQGETVVAWDHATGEALAPAISWQCRRSQDIVERLRLDGLEPTIRARTGLPLDPYFSGGKLAWLLEHDPKVRRAATAGTLRMGTVDAWLTARLDLGSARTDPSTASRTQLLRLDDPGWDDDLLRWFGVPRVTLPALAGSVGALGEIGHPQWGGSLPVRAMLCDQQAALAGHGAFRAGDLKLTLGTGAFVLANVGDQPVIGADVETSIGWTLPDTRPAYVLQGGVFTVGAFVDWLRTELGIIGHAEELDEVATSVSDTGGVRVMPALTGLGAPYWRPDARVVIAGASAATSRAHLVRAGLDGIAQLVVDVTESITALMPTGPRVVRVDGGLSACRYLVQRLADLLGRPVSVASVVESTALGVAGMAGIGAGLLGIDALVAANPGKATVEPAISTTERDLERTVWRRFVRAASDLK